MLTESANGVTNALQHWETALGRDRVLTGQAVQRYLADTGGSIRQVPACLLIKQADEVGACLRIAQQHRVRVYPISTGRNWGYGTALPSADGCVLLDLSQMRQILDFDPVLGVVTVEPGVTQGQLAEFLKAKGAAFLVPTTGAGPSTSLLANALERGYGITPIVDHCSAVTDIEAVLPDGSVHRSLLSRLGGREVARLYRWNVGPHLNGLFAQSGLGVVTRMTLQLARRPQAVKACLFGLRSDADLAPAVEAIRTAMGTLGGLVGGINLMNQRRVLSMTAPDQMKGLSEAELRELGRKHRVDAWTGFATLYGTRRTLKAAQAELKALLGPVGRRMLFVSPGRARMLHGIASRLPIGGLARLTGTLNSSLQLVDGEPNETALPLAYSLGTPAPKNQPMDPARDGCGLLWYAPLVPMRGQDVVDFVGMASGITPNFGIEPLITLTTQGGSLFDSTVPLRFDRSSADAVAQAHACYDALFQAGRERGWLPYRFGIDSMKWLASAEPDDAQLNRRIRENLDPAGILSPGRYAEQGPETPVGVLYTQAGTARTDSGEIQEISSRSTT
ncbi:FAD-binding oxidoreductase [Roseateles sp.]|uniref:FAD-binding oxidoreductase n=1 Tax=Roseateles sp. TaxID=1971397 RepID=UPI0039C95BDC